MNEDDHWPTPCPSDVNVRPFGAVNGLGPKTRGQRGFLGVTEDRREKKYCKHDTMPGHRSSETHSHFEQRRSQTWILASYFTRLTERCTKRHLIWCRRINRNLLSTIVPANSSCRRPAALYSTACGLGRL